MSDQIREVYRSETTIVGTSNNILFVFAFTSPQRQDIDIVANIFETMAAQWPSGLGFMFCARAGVRPPDQELRERVMGVVKKVSPNLRAMGWVVLGQGFMPAAVRSIFAALMLGIRAKYPTKVFSEVEPGIAWIAAQLEGHDGARFDQTALAGRAAAIVAASIPPARASAR